MYIKRTIKKTISPTWSEVIALKRQTFKTTLSILTFSLAYLTCVQSDYIKNRKLDLIRLS